MVDRAILAAAACHPSNSTLQVRGNQATFDTVTQPNPTQTRALELLTKLA